MSRTSRLLWSTWVADEQHWIAEVVGGVGRPRSNGLLEMLSFITLVGVSAAACLSVLGVVIHAI